MLRSNSLSGMHRGGFSRDPTMSDHDVDDIAFLTGSGQDSGFLMNKRMLYEPGSVLVCSQKRACLVVSLCFLAIITSAVIVAFTKPGCPVAQYVGEPLPGHGTFVTGGPKNALPLSESGEPFPWTDIRLPSHVKPLQYFLHLHPNLTSKYMKGEVKIKLTAREETQFIILHIRGINITRYSLHDKYHQPNPIDKFLSYHKNQQLYLGLRNTLRRGSNYTLRLDYEVWLTEGLDGFYLSSYMKDGEKRFLAATHFEPTSARAAFPCFDEPHLKARFHLSIVREENYISLFNMPLDRTVPVNGTNLVRDEYQTSVEMSTYLVCFVVCDFTRVSNKTAKNITVSVYAPSNIIEQADYALRATMTLLEFYQEFFTVDYPLPKLDLIAIPNFAAGAMENWGLVTYKETALMFVEGRSSSRAQQRVTVVIAHELAHQWFGNLVTMEWWQDLWLNEGFASFMECLGTSKAEPDWSMMDQFVVETVQPGLALDGLLSSHPVSAPVDDPANIESIFDAISYKKGASLIYMLEMFLGRPTVVEGLRSYLNMYSYSSATTKHLWEAFASASNKVGSLDVEHIMDTWTRQVGYPLVTVVVEDGHVSAMQKRFVSYSTNVTEMIELLDDVDGDTKEKLEVDTNAPLNETIGYRWHVPLTYVTSTNSHDPKLVWMNLTDIEFDVENDLSWLKFNVGQRGFYRVNYDPYTWEALIKQLKEDHQRLTSADRASLIDDAFALASAGELSASVALDLSLYLVEEEQYGPWHTALGHLFGWATRLYSDPRHRHMLGHICTVLNKQYQAMDWEDSGHHLKKLLRSEILQAAVDCGNEDAIISAQQMFQSWQADNYTIPPNLRSVVYKTGVRHGGEDAFHWCWHHYTNNSLASERRLLLQALAQTTDPWLIEQYLQYSLTGSAIRSQDVHFVITEVSKNPSGRLAVWRAVRKYWPHIMELYTHSPFALSAVIIAVTEHNTSFFDFKEVEQFFRNTAVGAGERALQAALETIRINVYWLERNAADVAQWLQEQYPEFESTHGAAGI